MVRSPEVATTPLRLVTELCAALDERGILACHWKSTNALDRSADGSNDLDLLVAEAHVPGFEIVLRELGFIEGIVPRSQRVPGIRHFYGLDDASGRLVDVHSHDRLVLGDDATKNYRLPIETAYLAASTRGALFTVPPPALELAVFVVRMMLKHGSPEAILTGRGSLSAGERAELRHLLDAAGPQRWRDVPDAAPMLPPPLLDQCLSSFGPGWSFPARIRVWHRLRRRLASFARRGRAADVSLQLWRRIEGRFRRIVLRRPPRKRPAGGGRVVAIVGGDGSGKSTTASSLVRWLSPVFETSGVHLGKPTRSLPWIAMRAWLHLARRLGVAGAAVPPPAGSPATAPRAGTARVFMGMLTTRDRRRAAEGARRRAARGEIVICDRYPVPELTVDVPRAHLAPQDATGISARLTGLEHGYHAGIPRPDIVVVLAVPPDVAVRRRRGFDPGVITARAQEVLEAAWSDEAVLIDATRPEHEVLADVKRSVWSRL